jgi:thiol:disulfide interchange protein
VTLAVRFKSPPPDRATLRVTYQACTDHACLPPVTKQVELVSE